MKKPTIHQFDANGRSLASVEHLEARLAALEAENERLKRIILLQERRWGDSYPPQTKSQLH